MSVGDFFIELPNIFVPMFRYIAEFVSMPLPSWISSVIKLPFLVVGVVLQGIRELGVFTVGGVNLVNALIPPEAIDSFVNIMGNLEQLPVAVFVVMYALEAGITWACILFVLKIVREIKQTFAF